MTPSEALASAVARLEAVARLAADPAVRELVAASLADLALVRAADESRRAADRARKASPKSAPTLRGIPRSAPLVTKQKKISSFSSSEAREAERDAAGLPSSIEGQFDEKTVSAVSPSSVAATPMPPTLALTPDARAIAEGLGVRNVDAVFLRFVAHNRKHGRRSADWLAHDWPGWVAKALELQQLSDARAPKQLDLPHTKPEDAAAFRVRAREDDRRHAEIRKARASPQQVAQFLAEARAAIERPMARAG